MFRARIGATLAILATLVSGTGGRAEAAATLTAPAYVYVAAETTSATVPLSFPAGAGTHFIHLAIDGYVTGATCTVGDSVVPVIAQAGEAVAQLTMPTVNGDFVACDVAVELPLPVPATLGLVVVESNSFNIEQRRATRTANVVVPDVTAGPVVVLSGGRPVNPALPRRVGDVLAYDITFNVPLLAGDPTVSVAVPSGTSITGCGARLSSDLIGEMTCSVSRALVATDLRNNVAPMHATLTLNGAPVLTAPADPSVFAENRIGLTVRADGPVVRVGEAVSLAVTVTNLGTSDLTALTLGNPTVALAGARCSSPLAVLTAGASVTCTVSHLARSGDVGMLAPTTVRATSATGSDTDLVNDEPTASADVDAAAAADVMISAASIAGAVSLDTSTIFLPVDTQTPNISGSVSVATVGALSNASVELPLHPATGLTTSGCTRTTSNSCVVDLGSRLAESLTTIPFELVADAALGNLAGLTVPATLFADGAIVVTLTSAAVSTAGLTVSLSDGIVDASDGVADVPLTMASLPGRDVVATVGALSSGTTLDSCRSGGSDIVVARTASGFTLAVPAATVVWCVLHRPVSDAERDAGLIAVELSATATAGLANRATSVSATVPTVALTVVAAPSAAVPSHGYSAIGSAERPNHVTQQFDVTLYGAATLTGVVTTANGGTASCAASTPLVAMPGQPAKLSCEVDHVVTVGDLASGTVSTGLTATGQIGSLDLAASATVPLAVPHESVDVRVTELSTPTGGQYRSGDELRILIQVKNSGTKPVEVTAVSLTVAATGSTLRSDGQRLVGADLGATGCVVPTLVPIGGGFDCTVSMQLTAGDFSGTVLSFGVVVSTARSVTASATFTAPANPTPRFVGTLPVTGSGVPTTLVAAVACIAVGVTLRSRARGHRTGPSLR
jgi:hypothetical protein